MKVLHPAPVFSKYHTLCHRCDTVTDKAVFTIALLAEAWPAKRNSFVVFSEAFASCSSKPFLLEATECLLKLVPSTVPMPSTSSVCAESFVKYLSFAIANAYLANKISSATMIFRSGEMVTRGPLWPHVHRDIQAVQDWSISCHYRCIVPTSSIPSLCEYNCSW